MGKEWVITGNKGLKSGDGHRGAVRALSRTGVTWV